MAIDQRDHASMKPNPPSDMSPPVPSPCRGGMTLVEVMVAVAVLAIGLMAVVGQIAPLNNQRQFTDDTQAMQNLLKTITERLATAPFDSLRSNSMAWTFVRRIPLNDGSLPGEDPPETTFESTSGHAIVPLNEVDAVDANNLVTQGLLLRPSGLRNVQVFLEYYRTISRFQSAAVWPVTYETDAGKNMLGLLCEANPSKPSTPSEFRSLVSSTTTRDCYAVKVVPNEALAVDASGLDHKFDALLVRVVITWGEGRLEYSDISGSYSGWKTNRRIEAWTGIRSSTDQ